MTTTATTLKTALLSLVGASLATDGWEDPVLAEALCQGLADLNAWLPPIEVAYTVVTPGAEQDLNSLAPQQILALATPWEETQRVADGRGALAADRARRGDAAGGGDGGAGSARALPQALHGAGPWRGDGHDAAALGGAHPAPGGRGARVPDPVPAAFAAAEHGAERPGFV